MVSFGPTTVFPSTPAASSTPAFGTTPATPAAPSGGIFGSSTTTPAPSSGGIFGNSTTTPAPSSGGIFGSSTTTTPGFGAPTPASGGFTGFGNNTTNTPAPSGSFVGGGFGSSTTNTTFGGFGAPAGSSLFGSTTQQQRPPPGPQVPYDAAMRAHLDASARNEEARVMGQLQQIHSAYTTGSITDNKSHVFTTVLYNPATPQERQLHAVNQSVLSNANVVIAPRPPQLTEQDWNLACIRTPDPPNNVPVAVVGANSLQARALSQQQRADTLQAQIQRIQSSQQVLSKKQSEIQQQIEMYRRKSQRLKVGLLKVMKLVEVARCFNLPMQKDEVVSNQKLESLKGTILQMEAAVSRLAEPNTSAMRHHNNNNNDVPQIPQEHQEKLMTILQNARTELTALTQTYAKDQRDLQLVKKRVVDS